MHTAFVLAASITDLGAARAARPHADVVEYRLDRSVDGVDALRSYDGVLPVLATNRVEREGGKAAATPARLDTLETAVEQPAVAAVDVELSAIRNGRAGRVVDRARAHDVAVVVSVHDFEATPDRKRLRRLLRAADEHGDIAKLAVTAERPGDVLDLLAVTHELSTAGVPLATVAMGEVGRHSRAVTPLYGSRLGYAPVDPADATAPGQYDLETLRTLLDQLRGTSLDRPLRSTN